MRSQGSSNSRKTWEGPGITFEMISYRTSRTDRIRERMIESDKEIPSSMAQFILFVAHTVHVTVKEDAPEWGKIIHEVFNHPQLYTDPLKIYDDLADAPSEVMDEWYIAYLRTRDKTIDAPPELQEPSPLPAEAYEAAGEEDEGKLNFTDSSTNSGGKVLSVMSSPSSIKPSTGRQRKAT
jgi:hypothetical protein